MIGSDIQPEGSDESSEKVVKKVNNNKLNLITLSHFPLASHFILDYGHEKIQ